MTTKRTITLHADDLVQIEAVTHELWCIRRRLRMSAAELSKACGLSPSYVSNFDNSRRYDGIMISTMQRFAWHLDHHLDMTVDCPPGPHCIDEMQAMRLAAAANAATPETAMHQERLALAARLGASRRWLNRHLRAVAATYGASESAASRVEDGTTKDMQAATAMRHARALDGRILLALTPMETP